MCVCGGGQVSGQGTAQWARKAGGTGDDYAHSVAVTATGAVVVVGRTSSATLHCQELRVARASEPFESYADPEDAMDAFTLSLDGNGMPTWGRADGGRNHDSARVRAHLRPPLPCDRVQGWAKPGTAASHGSSGTAAP